MFLTVDADAGELVDTMLPQIIQMLGSCKVSVYGRDNMMELLIKFVTRKDGVGWSRKFIDAQGFACFLSRFLPCQFTCRLFTVAVIYRYSQGGSTAMFVNSVINICRYVLICLVAALLCL